MLLIAGLGNPGKTYQLHRHNIGFLAVDYFLKQSSDNGRLPSFKNEFQSLTVQVRLKSESILVAKPQTYMNLSGEAIQKIMHFYKIKIENFLVVHDEIDLPFLQMKLQKNRGSAGHNGVRSINQQLNTQDYARLKLGVGKPENSHMSVEDFVLHNFTTEEEKEIPDFLNLASEAITSYIFNGPEKTASRFNQKRSE